MIAGNPHELPFRAQSFKEEGKLELEKDDWIDGWPPVESVAILDPLSGEREVEYGLQMAVEVVSGTRSSSEIVTGRSRTRGFGGPSMEVGRLSSGASQCNRMPLVYGSRSSRHFSTGCGRLRDF
jgi:hypothetical protein